MWENTKSNEASTPVSATDSELTALFLDSSRKLLFGQHWPRMKTCVESLTTDQIWWRPNEASNSIGNLLLHLNGNVRQWILVSFSHGEDKRDRPAEFAAKEGGSAGELLERLGATLDEAAKVLDRLMPAELLANYEVQGYHTNGIYVVYHVVEHFGLHYGQIAYITKLLSAKDLGFYKELNKTGRA
jgi:uncharacterized damage-inducible protein DinB